MRDLGKLIVAKGFKKLPKVQKIAQSGHTTSDKSSIGRDKSIMGSHKSSIAKNKCFIGKDKSTKGGSLQLVETSLPQVEITNNGNLVLFVPVENRTKVVRLPA